MTSINPLELHFTMDNNEANDFKIRLDSEGIEHKMEANSYDGSTLYMDLGSIANIVVAIGSTGIFASIAKVLEAYLRDRKKEVAIKSSGGRLELVAQNLSSDEIEKILQRLEKHQTIIISNK